jgi:single-strand DNA-binding protein
MTNIVVLAGHIGQAPEARQTQGGTRIVRFNLATSRRRYEEGKPLRDAEGHRIQDTEWHRIVCFNGLAITVEEYCEKGMKLLVRGRIHYTKWTDADGVERHGTEIIADSIDFLTRAPKAAPQEGSARSDLDDEIPF